MTTDKQRAATAWYGRYRSLRTKLALGGGAIMLVVAGVLWIKDKLLSIDPGHGAPVGLSVRTDRHIATLIQTLEAYVPSPNRNHGKDTYRYSLFLVPLDGSAPKLIPIGGGYPSSAMGLAKILGSDGRVLWFNVNGIGGVDLKRLEVLKPSEVRDPDIPKPKSPFPPRPDSYLAAGFIPASGQWLGLHSEEEVQGEFALWKAVRRVVSQESWKRMRRLHRGELDAPVDDRYHRILSLEPINEAEYFNAAFLRMDKDSEPIRLSDPDGALMIHTSQPGMKGTTVIARIDLDGRVRWSVDTAIDRFQLLQILPGEQSFAFVGTRLPVPGKVSEPLLVIVENATGKVATHSLWR